MLQLPIFTFITALHKAKYFLASFSLDSILTGHNSLVTQLCLNHED
jgi:hypothetical protein